MIAFDAHFVMLALRPAIPASADRAKDRVTNLVAELQKAGERILVATPALTEFLVHAESAAPRYLEELQKSAKFKISPYGLRAAVEVAAVIEAAVKKGAKKDGSRDTWAKVNFDRQIAATAKVEGAHTLYTDDANLKKFAEKMGLKVVTLEEVPIPESKHPLFDGVPDAPDETKKEEAITPDNKNSSELRADFDSSTGNAPGAPDDSDEEEGPLKSD